MTGARDPGVHGTDRSAVTVRAYFLNSGILGHASVARLLERTMEGEGDITAVHLSLSDGLTTRERIVRRLMCWGSNSATSGLNAITLARWRREMHVGILAARRLRAAERAHGHADVLHFHTQATAFASVNRMRRTPSIVSIDITQGLASAEVPDGPMRWQYAACAARDRAVFRAARGIVVTSRWAADDLVRGLPECTDRVHVMPYPVPLDGFDERWIEERAVRAARSEPVRVMFMGGDFPRKGGWDLLNAWRAADLGARAELHLVTDWPLDRGALPEHTTIHTGVRAYTADWFGRWRDTDLFVLPTTGEAFGMVFQEAAAAGVPCIGTNLNAVPELVESGETGILIPVRAPHALAAALQQLVSDAEVRRRMGAAARRRIARSGAPSLYGTQLLQLIRHVTTSAQSQPA